MAKRDPEALKKVDAERKAKQREAKAAGRQKILVEVMDFEEWTQIMRDEGWLLADAEGTVAAVTAATCSFIWDWCREQRRDHADAVGFLKGGAGLPEIDEQAQRQAELEAELEARATHQPHYVYRGKEYDGTYQPPKKRNRDPGRTLTPEQVAEILQGRPELQTTSDNPAVTVHDPYDPRNHVGAYFKFGVAPPRYTEAAVPTIDEQAPNSTEEMEEDDIPEGTTQPEPEGDDTEDFEGEDYAGFEDEES
jgi:hypothetical protein